jgi:hypothetical protein
VEIAETRLAIDIARSNTIMGRQQNLWVKTAENGEVCGGVRIGFSEGWQGK